MKKIVCFCLIFSKISMAQSVLLDPSQVSTAKPFSAANSNIVLSGDEATPSIIGLRANGTVANKTSIINGDRLFSIIASGYNGVNFPNAVPAFIGFDATQNWSSTAHGTAIDFFTTKNSENNGSIKMRIDHNGNVGIGTLTPEAKLHLFQNNANFNATLMLQSNVSPYRKSFISHSAIGETNVTLLDGEGFDIRAPQHIILQSNGFKINSNLGDQLLEISPLGNFGLGTPPTANAKFIVSSGPSGVVGGATTKAIFEDDTTHYVAVNSPDASESGIGFGRPSFGAFSGGIIYDSGNNLNFRTNINDTRMSVSATGNVGVGVSPIAKFHVADGLSGVGGSMIDVNKKLVVESSANTSLLLAAPIGQDLTINYARSAANSVSGAIDFTTNNNLHFNNNYFICSNGNVGIGNFTTVNPEAKLHVDGDYALIKKKLLSGNGGHSDEPRNGASVISIATPANGGGGETLGGLTDGIDGLLVYLYPVQGTSLTISNESTSSIAANRILTKSGGNLVLSNDGGVTLMYDANVSRWRMVAVAN